jgi:geranylgeranyl diphosphate synthase type II
MVHTYSLIHDDLPAMDDDDLRRGRPSCHAAFDEATAILAGDALLARAFEVMANDLPAPIAARCCAELARAAGATQMVGGQADDLMAEATGGDIQLLEAIHRRKTGAMLIAALRLGALTSEATDEQLERLTAYGTRLGLAFQIVDDLLDLTGHVDTMGKQAGQDRRHGKLTFPALLGPDESRRRAATLIDQAIEQLEPFASRAKHLVALARFVLERNR